MKSTASETAEFSHWYESLLQEVRDSEKAIGDDRSLELTEQISRRLEQAEDGETICRCVDLFTELKCAVPDSLMVSFRYTSRLDALAVERYEQKDFATAEYIFRRLSTAGSHSAKSNLAYMQRRGETGDGRRPPLGEIAASFRSGVMEREAFALMNMALLFTAPPAGAPEDWALGDAFVRLIPQDQVDTVNYWWLKTGMVEGDPEAYLVHLWLLRHKKSVCSRLGTHEELVEQVFRIWPHAPVWMKEIV